MLFLVSCAIVANSNMKFSTLKIRKFSRGRGPDPFALLSGTLALRRGIPSAIPAYTLLFLENEAFPTCM